MKRKNFLKDSTGTKVVSNQNQRLLTKRGNKWAGTSTKISRTDLLTFKCSRCSSKKKLTTSWSFIMRWSRGLWSTTMRRWKRSTFSWLTSGRWPTKETISIVSWSSLTKRKTPNLSGWDPIITEFRSKLLRALRWIWKGDAQRGKEFSAPSLLGLLWLRPSARTVAFWPLMNPQPIWMPRISAGLLMLSKILLKRGSNKITFS